MTLTRSQGLKPRQTTEEHFPGVRQINDTTTSLRDNEGLYCAASSFHALINIRHWCAHRAPVAKDTPTCDQPQAVNYKLNRTYRSLKGTAKGPYSI